MSIRTRGAAWRRMLLSLAVPAVVAVSAVGAGGGPVAANASSSYLTVDVDAPIRGLPAPWRLRVNIVGYPKTATFVGLELIRQTPAGHGGLMAWSGQTPAMTCGARLATCSLATGTSLGSYGRLSLAFQATAGARTQTSRCPGTDAVVSTSRSRAGVLTGTLRLTTGDPWFGTIRNRASAAHRVAVRLPAVVTRHIDMGVICKSEGSCPRWFVLQAVSGITAMRDRVTGTGRVTAYVALPSKVAGVTVYAGAMIRTHGAPALAVDNDPDPLGASTTVVPPNPYLDGTVIFTLHAPLETPASACSVTRRAGTIDSTLVLHLPGMAALPIPSTTGYLERTAP